jgi:hypothetical protein
VKILAYLNSSIQNRGGGGRSNWFGLKSNFYPEWGVPKGYSPGCHKGILPQRLAYHMWNMFSCQSSEEIIPRMVKPHRKVCIPEDIIHYLRRYHRHECWPGYEYVDGTGSPSNHTGACLPSQTSLSVHWGSSLVLPLTVPGLHIRSGPGAGGRHAAGAAPPAAGGPGLGAGPAAGVRGVGGAAERLGRGGDCGPREVRHL